MKKSDIAKQLCAELGIPLLTGQCYTWEQPGGGTITWSINEALKIIGDRPPLAAAAMPPDMQREALLRNGRSIELDYHYAMTTDLTKPVIAVISPWETSPTHIVLLFIDGWHRILKSVATNNPNDLQVHVLSPDEEKACRIDLLR